MRTTPTHPTRTTQEQTETPAPAVAPAPAPAPAPRRLAHGLDARMAATNAAMTPRLQRALLAIDVNSAGIDTGPRFDLADVITGPVQLPEYEPEPEPYPTPAAATLQRAARRLRAGGWCRNDLVDTEGARCLYGAIRAEAPTGRAADDAMSVLLDVIRRSFPDARSVPDANDRHLHDTDAAAELLDAAAYTAHASGL